MKHELLELQGALAGAPETVVSTFAVSHSWPDIKNAEYEVLQRLSKAAANIGAVMIAIDNDGHPLWSSDRRPLERHKPIDPASIDFLISLHFESPRLLDVYSYYALWQPLDFYDTFGYEKTSESILSHVDALSCSSDMADAHVENLFRGARSAPWGSFPYLFHSPPKPYYEPNISADSKLFYIGINWERINAERGRHHDLLEKLNDDGLIDIYGPRLFLGVEPWRDFSAYRGELAFDGQSVVRAIHKSGICLALSSEAHKKSALMSNRLFEGLAAGAAIIASTNGFIDKYFADVVYTFDDTLTGDELYFTVRDLVEEIRANPEEAKAKAIEGQRRLEEMFSLERCLATIVTQHPARAKAFEDAFMSRATVSVVLVYAGDSLSELERCIEEVAAQRGVSVSLSLVCDRMLATLHTETLAKKFSARLAAFEVVSDQLLRYGSDGSVERQSPTGPLVRKVLSGISTEFFALKRSDEVWFSDHLATVMGAVEADPEASFGMSGAIEEKVNHVGGIAETVRTIDTVRFTQAADGGLLDASLDDGGRFVYRRKVLDGLPTATFGLLDGYESYLVRMAAARKGKVAHSGFATFVRMAAARAQLPETIVSAASQRRYVADAFAADPQRMERTDMRTGAAGAGAASAWSIGDAPPLGLGRIVDVVTGGDGLSFVVGGLSKPEKTFTWVEGRKVSLAFSIFNAAELRMDDLDLVLWLGGRPSQIGGRDQHVSIVVNGIAVAYAQVPEAEVQIQIRLPRGLAPNGRFRVDVVADHAEQVTSPSGRVIDPRYISLRLYRFGLLSQGAYWGEVAELETTYHLTASGNGAGFLGAGFYDAEEAFTWMPGGESRLHLRFEAPEKVARLTLGLLGRKSLSDGSAQEIKVFVNRREAATLLLTESFGEYTLPVEPGTIDSTGNCTIRLVPKHSDSTVGAKNRIVDPRLLSAAIRSLRVDPVYPVAFGRPLSFAKDEAGGQHVLSGFSHAEPGWTWIDGTSGKLQFDLDDESAAASFELVCVMGGRSFQGVPPTCKVLYRGIVLGEVTIPDGIETFRFVVGKDVLERRGHNMLEFRLSHADPVVDDRKKVVDPRRLALRLASITVQKAE